MFYIVASVSLWLLRLSAFVALWRFLFRISVPRWRRGGPGAQLAVGRSTQTVGRARREVPAVRVADDAQRAAGGRGPPSRAAGSEHAAADSGRQFLRRADQARSGASRRQSPRPGDDDQVGRADG